MNKKIGLTVIMVLFLISLLAQDGSNISYYDPTRLNKSLIGKYCHVDFGEESFGGLTIDTIEIKIKGQRMKFYEHRKDNGFNNCFNEQYLIRVEDKNQIITRLKNSRIDSLTADKIYLTSILSYYINESPIDTITVFQHWYERKNISKVLVKK